MSPNVDRSKTVLSDEEMCRKCSTPWCDSNYSLSIAPIKLTKRKTAKIHKQIDDQAKRKGNLARKLAKRANNLVVIFKIFLSKILDGFFFNALILMIHFSLSYRL